MKHFRQAICGAIMVVLSASYSFANPICFNEIAKEVTQKINAKMKSTGVTVGVYSIEHIGSGGTYYSSNKNTYVDNYKVSASGSTVQGQVYECQSMSVAVIPDASGQCHISIDSIKSNENGDNLCKTDGTYLK